MRNWTQTILSQYSDSTRLLNLLGYIDEWIAPDANFEQFYNLVWNLDSAQGYGLNVWGRIVGVTRVVSLESGSFFGYTGSVGPVEASGDSFTVESFFEGAFSTTNFSLTDDSFRQLILAKAAANLTDGSIPSINALLMNLFPGRGNAYIADGLDMTLTYTFTFALQPFEKAIVQTSGVLPRSVGSTPLYSYVN